MRDNTFTNVYKAAPVVPAEFATGITGTKTVTASEGNSYTMQGGEFSFTLTPAASNPSTDPVERDHDHERSRTAALYLYQGR